MSYFNMGLVYRRLEKAEVAQIMFTKAYSIFLKVLGPDQLHTQQVKSEVDRSENGIKAKSRQV